MARKSVFTILIALFVVLVASLVIMFFANGYTLDIKTRDIQQTGILSINSTPNGALIYLNGTAHTATNTSITSLTPDSYTVELEKSGYRPWTKQIILTAGLVKQIDALLVTYFPEIRPLTTTGVDFAVLGPDRQRVVYARANSGIWLLDLAGRPFNLVSRPTLLIQDLPTVTFSDSEIAWSPDAQSLLIITSDGTAYTYDLESKELVSLTAIQQEQLLNTWTQENQETESLLENRFSLDIRSLIPAGTTLEMWSPDQTKILYSQKEEDKTIYKVLDLHPKEQKGSAITVENVQNYTVLSTPLESFIIVSWYSDSEHLLLLEYAESSDIVSIIEIEGTNKTPIFSGSVLDNFYISHPDGSKIILLTNFTPEDTQRNLYSVNIY